MTNNPETISASAVQLTAVTQACDDAEALAKRLLEEALAEFQLAATRKRDEATRIYGLVEREVDDRFTQESKRIEQEITRHRETLKQAKTDYDLKIEKLKQERKALGQAVSAIAKVLELGLAEPGNANFKDAKDGAETKARTLADLLAETEQSWPQQWQKLEKEAAEAIQELERQKTLARTKASEEKQEPGKLLREAFNTITSEQHQAEAKARTNYAEAMAGIRSKRTQALAAFAAV